MTAVVTLKTNNLIIHVTDSLLVAKQHRYFGNKTVYEPRTKSLISAEGEMYLINVAYAVMQDILITDPDFIEKFKSCFHKHLLAVNETGMNGKLYVTNMEYTLRFIVHNSKIVDESIDGNLKKSDCIEFERNNFDSLSDFILTVGDIFENVFNTNPILALSIGGDVNATILSMNDSDGFTLTVVKVTELK